MKGLFDYLSEGTEKKLAEALAKLMEDESFDQITTSEIIQKSGISRSTFYRKYDSKNFSRICNN